MRPPPKLTDNPSAAPLTDNAFVFEGASVRYLQPVTVTCVDDGKVCAATATLDDRTVVAEKWRDHADPPPGSTQHIGRLTVRFRPARPGASYRATTGTGSTTRRYDGPPVD